MNEQHSKKDKFKIEHWHKIAFFMIFYDVLTIAFSYLFALLCRFDFHYSIAAIEYGSSILRFLPLYVLGTIFIYYQCHLYKSIWRFSSLWEVEHIFLACGLSFFYSLLVSLVLSCRLPIAAYIIGIVFQLGFTVMLRFGYRFALIIRSYTKAKANPKKKGILIGAGAAGQMLLHDTKKTGSPLEIVCIIDDNTNKHNRLIDGVRVIGGREKIKEAVKEFGADSIIFAIPSASAAQKKEILEICQETGLSTQILPSLLDLAASDVNLNNLKDIQMEDLLGRDPIQVDNSRILDSLGGKVVLVTGGGGSIGSELCRQIAAHQPAKLIILDIYENNAYDIQNELKRSYPALNLEVIIASVRDSRRINMLFESYRPQVIFHAAAHKHVPLMEVSPCEAIKNNAFGTYKVAKAALEYNAERFILISTDKAVRPTNIMGASKRLCEMIIQTMNDISTGKIQEPLPEIDSHSPAGTSFRQPGHTQFVAVRFGNVLGSNGSVIPLFTKQIEKGGPVTVTHPDIIRYFMTIPEAVSLVLQASVYARGGEIFVLDMGNPVKIDDLARKLIRLSGHVPNGDIQIIYTGLRPGEKLFEEKLMAEEGLEKTENELIHIGKPVNFDRTAFLTRLPWLYETAMNNYQEKTIVMTLNLVKTYRPDWNSFKENELIDPLELLKESQQDPFLHLTPRFDDGYSI